MLPAACEPDFQKTNLLGIPAQLNTSPGGQVFACLQQKSSASGAKRRWAATREDGETRTPRQCSEPQRLLSVSVFRPRHRKRITRIVSTICRAQSLHV